MRKLLGLWDDLRAFARAKTGNVAMMFGLSLLPLALAAGAGLDYAQAMMVRASMMDALDAAALAVGGAANDKTVDPNKLAQDVFNANYKGPGHPTVTPSINGQSVKVTGNDNVATTMLAMAGMPSIAVSATSIVVWGQTKLWVSLVLDNTGSMSQKDSTGLSKIAALQDASHQLLAKLQTAAASGAPGDVQVAIIPFAKDVNVGVGNVNASWLDWSDWNLQYGSAPSSSVGPGSTCPWSSGIKCVNGPGSTDRADNVPSSGLICPDAVGSSTTGQSGHYYDGCYNSIPTQTQAVTNITKSTPTTIVQTCSQTGSGNNKGPVTCTQTSSTVGSATNPNSSSTATTAGYTGDSVVATSSTQNGTPSDDTANCSGSGASKVCTWTRTTVNKALSGTITSTGVGPYNHAWVVNAHSVWRGCVMDRNQNDDTTSATPGNKFPVEQSDSCNEATVMPLNYKWDFTSSNDTDNLSAKIDSMKANGGTNQTIGLAHGMQIQMEGDPYNAPALPANTTRYIILLSDGLNTMDRWYGDGSNQSASVDTRMALACTNAKNQGFIIYTLFVDIAGAQGNSTVLRNCATDTSKYYDLTTSSAIVTAFNDIAQKITNLRVSR